jgi:hypothetical protein
MVWYKTSIKVLRQPTNWHPYQNTLNDPNKPHLITKWSMIPIRPGRFLACAWATTLIKSKPVDGFQDLVSSLEAHVLQGWVN